MTIHDELVEIGARAVAKGEGRSFIFNTGDDWYDTEGFKVERKEYERGACECLTAILPELAKMMLEPGAEAFDHGHDEWLPYVAEDQKVAALNAKVPRRIYNAMLIAFFRERFGISIDQG